MFFVTFCYNRYWASGLG